MSFILCTGLKKCIPTTREGSRSVAAISVRLSADVFDATTALPARAVRCRRRDDFGVDAFGRRFDDEVGSGQGLRQVAGRLEPAKNHVGVGRCDLAALDASADDLFDRTPSLLERLGRHVEHRRIVARRRGRMRDPVPHRSRHRSPRSGESSSPPRSDGDDIVQHRHRLIHIVFVVVEVRRDADAGVRAVVDDDVTTEEVRSRRPRRSARRGSRRRRAPRRPRAC